MLLATNFACCNLQFVGSVDYKWKPRRKFGKKIKVSKERTSERTTKRAREAASLSQSEISTEREPQICASLVAIVDEGARQRFLVFSLTPNLG